MRCSTTSCGGVHDPGVDVARPGQPEQGGRVLGVPEGVGRGLVDRQGTRVGRRPGVCPAWTCLVSNAQLAVDLRGVGLMWIGSCKWVRGAPPHGHESQRFGGLGHQGGRQHNVERPNPHQVSLSTLGARHGGPALAVVAHCRLLNLVNHPGHPTAVGGLPASEPGLTLALMTVSKA